MTKLASLSIAGALVVLATAVPTAADTPLQAGAVATVGGLGPNGSFPVLTRGQVVFVNAQRLVVTQEPPPVAQVSEPPPLGNFDPHTYNWHYVELQNPGQAPVSLGWRRLSVR